MKYKQAWDLICGMDDKDIAQEIVNLHKELEKYKTRNEDALACLLKHYKEHGAVPLGGLIELEYILDIKSKYKRKKANKK